MFSDDPFDGSKGRLKMTANEFKSVQRCAAKPISNELK